MKKSVLTATLALALALPVAAYAGGGHHGDGHSRVDRMFERWDTNKDGRLSQAEVPDGRHKYFSRFDSDKDGEITLSEAREAHEKMREARLARFMEKIDTDKDGKVSEAEYTSFAMERFKSADSDSDGALSVEEMKNFRKSFAHKGKGGEAKQ
ncbi:EF-hand domain-containing protein [Sneathiella chinensis]|uniref:EF-hand domain-containing protein n=1 Tax=Sneathiella chinensis TaxID=349750 RepID=A0ABQ5U1D9_9PROT|nr:EF-hand domain-containing protein [Sneathiella chinensis]GLQ05491.1 hypothetical protein GCM10007924_07120 [Sneathiella chinensis]